MDDCVDKGNAKCQDPITDETAEIVIFFACSQVHELCEIIKYKEEWTQNGKQPGIISVT